MDAMIRRTLALAVAAVLLAVAPAAAASAEPAQAPGCDIESASLSWGFKESFRAYIDGSIANGEWTVGDGATYATPEFGFLTESGRIDPRAPLGSLWFTGSVRFTGHGGILDTTIANPTLVLGADGSATLRLDVSGPTMEGDQVAVTGAVFVDVDLTGQDFTPRDGIITISEAPTQLTEEGAEAFPNYEAGTEFDPISARIDVGECDLTGQPIGTDSYEEPGVIGNATPFVIILAVIAGVLAIVVVLLVVTRLRRR
jgi:large repetitive protein